MFSEERTHRLEYGVVALLIYEALVAIVATSAIGAIDECIQANV